MKANSLPIESCTRDQRCTSPILAATGWICAAFLGLVLAVGFHWASVAVIVAAFVFFYRWAWRHGELPASATGTLDGRIDIEA